jgi:hypothetical protein
VKFIKTWLWADFFVAVFLWATIGAEGLAAMACAVIEHPNCEELREYEEEKKMESRLVGSSVRRSSRQ